jgi:hypothetical protein
MAIRDIRKVSVGVYFVSNSQITQSPTAIFGQDVTEIDVSVLFNNELYSDHRDAVLPVKEEESFGTLINFVFMGNLCRKISPRYQHSLVHVVNISGLAS